MIELTPPTLTIHLILQILTRHKSIFMCVCVCVCYYHLKNMYHLITNINGLVFVMDVGCRD